VLRGKMIAINTYIKKEETSQINNLSLYFKELKKEHCKLKTIINKEIIKIDQKLRKCRIENNKKNQ
jgi:hypothetical protein